MKTIIELYEKTTGKKPVTCTKIAGSGSNRQYFRLKDELGSSMIGVAGTSSEENASFLYLSKHFQAKNLNVPEILSVSNDTLTYLQTDLGNTTLYDALKTGRENPLGYSSEDIKLLEQAISILPKIQVHGAEGIDFKRCYPQESMDRQNVMFDLNYFKYYFLKTTKIEFNEAKLEECFMQIAHDFGSVDTNFFMYRDFQSRNLMLSNDGKLYFIDYQGGRRGSLQYDLVSFLWQASSHFNHEIKQHLINIYIESLKQYMPLNEEEFKESIPRWVLFRTLQVLGAYGYRGKFEGKKYFLDSIPAAITNLREILEIPNSCPYPYLLNILKEMVNLPEFASSLISNTSAISCNCAKKQLRVRVFSFSYKKGIPQDDTGNGGGYVFDCRSIHNPGRFEQYKKQTGLDKPVIDFLEKDAEITIFLDNIYKLADAHVERYIQRGFTSLMFSFGCTGGQHRSVYSAQHLAEHLSEKYGIEVSLQHLEQGISHTFLPRKKAMIFAAGLGTRLKPLTDNRPKALVEIAGKPLIEHVLRKLVSAGFNDIVINVHHYANMIEEWVMKISESDFIKKNNVNLFLSDERTQLLETGGGIKHATSLLARCNPEQRFLVHNVDILSNVDLDHFTHNVFDIAADALLLVSKRKTARYLVLNNDMRLVGWTNIQTGEIRTPYDDVRNSLAQLQQDVLDSDLYHLRAFAGIHMVGTNLLELMSSWPSKFSIIDFYISICKDMNIKGYVQDNLNLVDVGKIDTLSLAEEFANNMQE